ncbi:MAG: VOC family protein [Acidobacteriota bacterium]|nr:VOC family protein [Acidobacteriota bacterium]
MLKTWKTVAFVGVRDAGKARAFYGGTLGLRLVEDTPFALVYDSNGVTLRVSLVPTLTPAGFTVLGWEVPDMDEAIRTLAAAGVAFRRYEGIAQDERGVWTAPGGTEVAWFEDPEGNILSLSRH